MTVVSMADARRRRAMTGRAKYNAALSAQEGPPAWQNDIRHCCAYARMLKAEHAAERERIHFELLRDHDGVAWWTAPKDIQERVHENNRLWDTYLGLLQRIAALPAETRRQAQDKRATIGRQWLKPGNAGFDWFVKMREGCLADDHLFPPSSKLARLEGDVRVC